MDSKKVKEEIKKQREWEKKVNKSRYGAMIGKNLIFACVLYIVGFIPVFFSDNYTGWKYIVPLAIIYMLMGIGKVIAAIGVSIDEAICNERQQEQHSCDKNVK